mmetsp:Transcript_4279/g.10153  ORF Transcript_4279/g.10153 Transcript_4279/m.10153 type:complete len:245 (+) Transcript_4279:533-1267(+)
MVVSEPMPHSSGDDVSQPGVRCPYLHPRVSAPSPARIPAATVSASRLPSADVQRWGQVSANVALLQLRFVRPYLQAVPVPLQLLPCPRTLEWHLHLRTQQNGWQGTIRHGDQVLQLRHVWTSQRALPRVVPVLQPTWPLEWHLPDPTRQAQGSRLPTDGGLSDAGAYDAPPRRDAADAADAAGAGGRRGRLVEAPRSERGSTLQGTLACTFTASQFSVVHPLGDWLVRRSLLIATLKSRFCRQL